MLILERQTDQEIVITPGDGLNKQDRRITIKIVKIRGSIVKLGISAPLSTLVDRAEIDQARNPQSPIPNPQLKTRDR